MSGQQTGPGPQPGHAAHRAMSATAEQTSYVPLPSQIRQLATATLRQVSGPGGTPLTD